MHLLKVVKADFGIFEFQIGKFAKLQFWKFAKKSEVPAK